MENFDNQLGTSESRVQSLAVSQLMRNVYLWMTAALAITGLTAMVVANSASIFSLISSSAWTVWGLFIAELVIVIALSAAINKLSFGAATGLFILYSVINGLTLSSIFVVYTQASIASTFFICAGTFAGMAILGSVTKKDLSGIGRFGLMALIGLIIASIVNIFMKSSALYWIITLIGVVLFAALTAYDSQKIKQMLYQMDDVNDSTQKIALLGALTLYLDFINLFLYLLRLFGRNK